MRRLGALTGRWLRAALKPPLDHRFLTAAVILTGLVLLVVDLVEAVSMAVFSVVLAVALAYGLLRIFKSAPGEGDDPCR